MKLKVLMEANEIKFKMAVYIGPPTGHTVVNFSLSKSDADHIVSTISQKIKENPQIVSIDRAGRINLSIPHVFHYSFNPHFKNHPSNYYAKYYDQRMYDIMVDLISYPINRQLKKADGFDHLINIKTMNMGGTLNKVEDTIIKKLFTKSIKDKLKREYIEDKTSDDPNNDIYKMLSNLQKQKNALIAELKNRGIDSYKLKEKLRIHNIKY